MLQTFNKIIVTTKIVGAIFQVTWKICGSKKLDEKITENTYRHPLRWPLFRDYFLFCFLKGCKMKMKIEVGYLDAIKSVKNVRELILKYTAL